MRFGKCGHPLHPVDGCRVCWLLDRTDGEGVLRHAPASAWRGREDDANAFNVEVVTGFLPVDLVVGVEMGRVSLPYFIGGYVGHTARGIPCWNEHRERTENVGRSPVLLMPADVAEGWDVNDRTTIVIAGDPTRVTWVWPR